MSTQSLFSNNLKMFQSIKNVKDVLNLQFERFHKPTISCKSIYLLWINCCLVYYLACILFMISFLFIPLFKIRKLKTYAVYLSYYNQIGKNLSNDFK